MKKIIIIGSFNLDFVFFVDRFVKAAETYHSKGMEMHYGGKGFNQAIACAKVYPDVSLAINVNEKEAYIKRVLADNNVKNDFVRITKSPTGMAFIQVNQEGENSILLNKGANYQFDLEQFVEILNQYKTGDLLVLQNEINYIDQLINIAHKRHLSIALNPSPFSQDLLQLPLEKCSYLFINEVEGEALTKQSESQAILNEIATKYPQCEIVLTLGSKGALVQKGQEIYQQDAFKVTSVDSTGAGDTFTGFYLGEKCLGKSMQESLRFASAASALSVTKKGAMDSIPSLHEVLAFLEQQEH